MAGAVGAGDRAGLEFPLKWEGDPLGEISREMRPASCHPHPSGCWMESRLRGRCGRGQEH